MRQNRVRTIWQNGGAVVNGWLHIPSSYAAETMAHTGWDSLTIDMQHGPVDYQVAVTMLQAISTTDVIPFARVPWNEPGIIMKMLDAGCYGIICPMINSSAEAAAFVGACHYPPAGYRSNGPNRALLYAGPDYASAADDTIIAMAMIETVQAVAQIDDILTVPGLDAIYVGPADLSRSMGDPPNVDFAKPKLAAALQTIVTAARKHQIVAGIHTGSPAAALHAIDLGYQFVTIQSDARIMAAAAGAAVSAVKGRQTAPVAQSGPY